MSLMEIQRFTADLDTNADLRAAAHALAAGNPVSFDTLTALATSRGYDVSVDDLRQHVRAQAEAGGRTLTDEDLDGVSGGVAPLLVIAGITIAGAVVCAAISGAAFGYVAGTMQKR